MPDARSSFWNGATQGGSNADNVLADAYVKGVGRGGGINWADGLAAMLTDADVVPPNNNDPRDPSGSTAEGRGALPDWLKYGFITPSFGRSVSRAVEYSVNDYAVYAVASALGLDTATVYLDRSRNWRNHWNRDVSSLGFSGFVMPRTTSGFISQDPLSCGGCYWSDYCEYRPSPSLKPACLHVLEEAGEQVTLTHRQTTKPSPGSTPSMPITTLTHSSATPGASLHSYRVSR